MGGGTHAFLSMVVRGEDTPCRLDTIVLLKLNVHQGPRRCRRSKPCLLKHLFVLFLIPSHHGNAAVFKLTLRS